MNDIRCPKCGEVFKVDEAGYADIVKQVHDREFKKELHEREELLKADKESAIKLVEEKTKNALKDDLAKKDAKIAELKAEKDIALTQLKSNKDAELSELKSKIVSAETEKKLAVTEAVNKIEKERDKLANELKNKDIEKQLLESSLKDKYEIELKSKDEMIAHYKEMKAKLSTKMLGESLEQHCEIEFNRLRAAAFPNAYFEKDNDTKTGSKGDYIYREMDQSGNEIISIMFEMKNEQDETTTKKKNEEFLRELDKDRTEKKCEFAVLVSLLEADNDLYNTGIVDVSHRYPKMYVIRPQFFIPILTLLRNASLGSLKYKIELALVKSQNIDITNFESELHLFQDSFMKNVKDSSSKFQEAIDGIDGTIKKLEAVKEALRLSNKHLLTAGSKVESVSVKRLTKDNPTMEAKFAELNKDKN